jgi:cytochrome c oxidase subunit II
VDGPSLSNLLPETATELASYWDQFFYFLVGMSLFLFIPLVITALWFVFKYRRSKNPNPSTNDDNTALEIFWTAVPTFIVIVIFAWGWIIYQKMYHAPKGSYEVRVIGKQWLWQFDYSHGKSTIGDLYVPANQRVKLIMTSDDVLHSFFVPDFRIKNDTVPGIYTSVWFEANKPGEHTIYCSEYCGLSHSKMMGKVKALSTEDWNKWLEESSKETDLNLSPLELGKKLYTEKGCAACHSLDGTDLVGPSFKGVWGTTQTMEDGSTHKVDENFIRLMIEYPDKYVVKGYPKVMPSFKGLLNERELAGISAFIKSLGTK